MQLSRSLRQIVISTTVPTLALALLCCGSETDFSESPEAQSLEAHRALASSAQTKSSAVFIRPTAEHSLCLAVVGEQNRDGAQVAVETCDESDKSQAWDITGGRIKIFGDKCLDVTSGKDRDGTKLQIWTCAKDNTNQQWSWQGHTLKWKNHTRCVDLTDGAKQPGTRAQIWACIKDNTNQQWRLSTGGTTPTQKSPNSNAPIDGDEESASNGSNSANAAPANQTMSRLSVSGSNLVDASGKVVLLKGTNLGGWLVTENWMCGMSDASDGTGRFARETLEKRFGEAAADTLLNLWYDTWLTTKDFDNMKSIGMNVARIPFGWRNLQHANHSWRKNTAGEIDFSRLDWAVNELSKRGIYSILDFHIWDSQQTSYSRISEQSSQSGIDQQHAAAIWTEVAKHFANNNAVAAYDIINEPTGSAGNKMQNVLYQAVRAQDATRPIIMESVSANPASLKWQHVVYSFHEYNMMTENTGNNQSALQKDDAANMAKWKGFPVPVYIGEFMAQGDSPTLPFMIKAFNQKGYSWTSWTLKTVNMGSWGLYNFHPKSGNLDILHDSIETLSNKIKDLGSATEQQPSLGAVKGAINAK